jgi:hypothetical protein
MSRFIGKFLSILGLVSLSNPTLPLLTNFEMPLQDVTSGEPFATVFANPVLNVVM